MTQREPDLDEAILKSLTRRRIDKICHFTPCDRLPGIFEHNAILCFRERQSRGIPESEAEHFWGSVGKKEELADFVICAFMPPWGMMRRHDEEMAILTISASVCALPGVCFCPTNSAFSTFPAGELVNRTGVAHFDACFQSEDTYQANDSEILVPDCVPLRFVEDIQFCDRDAGVYWLERVNEVDTPGEDDTHVIQARVGSTAHFRFPPYWTPTRRIRP